jgi:hypothetical protein
MMQAEAWIALGVGFVQGYLAFALTILLIQPISRLVLGSSYDPSPISRGITGAVTFVFLCLAFFSLGSYCLDLLAPRHDAMRTEIGKFWRSGLFLGFVVWAFVLGTVKRFGKTRKV